MEDDFNDLVVHIGKSILPLVTAWREIKGDESLFEEEFRQQHQVQLSR